MDRIAGQTDDSSKWAGSGLYCRARKRTASACEHATRGLDCRVRDSVERLAGVGRLSATGAAIRRSCFCGLLFDERPSRDLDVVLAARLRERSAHQRGYLVVSPCDGCGAAPAAPSAIP